MLTQLRSPVVGYLALQKPKNQDIFENRFSTRIYEENIQYNTKILAMNRIKFWFVDWVTGCKLVEAEATEYNIIGVVELLECNPECFTNK